MTYQYTVNKTPSNGAEAMFNIKTTLKNAGWTVPRSSDGTTYNSTGDQITGFNSGANGFANTQAWFVIQQPVGGRQFCIQRGSNNQLHRVKYSLSAGFTGGTPGATQTPSATDEQILMGAGTDATPSFPVNAFYTDNTYRQHVAADNAAPYSFYAITYGTGGFSPNSIFWMDGLLTGSPSPSDNDQYVIWITHANSNTGTLMNSANPSTVVQQYFSTYNSSAYNQGPICYLRQGLSGAGFVPMPILHYLTNNGNNLVIPGNAGSNPHTGGDDLFPAIYLRQPTASIVAPTGYKGISGLFQLIGTTRAVGDTITVSTTADHICFGALVFPWNGSTPLV